MNEYIVMMFGDAPAGVAGDNGAAWGEYIGTLRQSGQFDGGSSIGAGERHRKGEPIATVQAGVTGFLRIRAASIADARRFLIGNPAYEAGCSIEIRELPRD